jgi:hypothetical protein
MVAWWIRHSRIHRSRDSWNSRREKLGERRCGRASSGRECSPVPPQVAPLGDPGVVVGVQVVERQAELVVQFAAQRVAPVRAVERQGRDAALLLVHQRLEFHALSIRVDIL